MSEPDLSNPKSNGINPFVTGLSIVNLFYSLLMTLFGYTLYLLLEREGVSLYWGALGVSLGQLALLAILIPQGRAIDRGHSYSIMVVGSIVYSVSIGVLSLSGALFRDGLIFAIPVAILIAIASQNAFRSSMNSFIGKAVRSSLMGSNYARILTMEMVGGALAMVVAYFIGETSSIRYAYIIFPALLIISVSLVFTVLYRDSRTGMALQVSSIASQSLRQGLRNLSSRRRFLIPIYAGKIFMAIGFYGFSYYFILTGVSLGLGPEVPILLLAAVFAASIPFGKLAESVLQKFPNNGKAYVIMISIIDVFSYLLIFISTISGNIILYFASVAVMIPGPLPTSGALGYEVRMVGKENRGIYASFQRILVAIAFIVVSFPMVELYYMDIYLLWLFILATSLLGLLSGIMLPGEKKNSAIGAQEGSTLN